MTLSVIKIGGQSKPTPMLLLSKNAQIIVENGFLLCFDILDPKLVLKVSFSLEQPIF
jgi:hypothetical protein